MGLLQTGVLCGQLFHVDFAVPKFLGQLASGGVEHFQLVGVFSLVFLSGAVELDFLQAVKDRLQTLVGVGIVIETADFFHSGGLAVQRFL